MPLFFNYFFKIETYSELKKTSIVEAHSEFFIADAQERDPRAGTEIEPGPAVQHADRIQSELRSTLYLAYPQHPGVKLMVSRRMGTL
jgi:hypothetical protein